MEATPGGDGHGDQDLGEPGKCNAKRHQKPGLCRNPAGFKTDHPGIGRCHLHGGKTESHLTAAARERVHREASMALRREGIEPVNDPLQQLQHLAGEVINFKNILAEQVEQLSSWETYDNLDKEELRAIIQAYERALDRTEKTLSSLVRLNIEERLARVTEAQARMLIGIFEAVFSSKDVGMNKTQVIAARAVVAKEIPRVTGRAA